MTDITLNTVDKSVIGKFNTMLDKYAKDKNSLDNGVVSISVEIVKSKSINETIVKSSNTIDSKDIRGYVDAFINQVLGIEKVSDFDRNKRMALNEAMTIALALIKKNALGQNSKGKSVANGNLMLKGSVDGVDDKDELGNVPYTKKDSLAWAKSQLKFVEKKDKKTSLHKKGLTFFDALGKSEGFTGIWANFDKTNKIDIGSIKQHELKKWFNALKDVVEQVNIQSKNTMLDTDIKLTGTYSNK
jgi:hypothetical protein